MAAKKTKKEAKEKANGEDKTPIKSKADLKAFLLNVRDKLADETAAPIYAVSALNCVMSDPGVYALLNKENKELARDIWLRIKQAGFHMENPRLLFDAEEEIGL